MADYQEFDHEARLMAAETGASPSVGAFLRIAGRKLLETRRAERAR